MKKSDSPIIVEENFNTPAKVIWQSITDHEQMLKWYFDNIPAFKPEIGFYTEFNVNSGERNFLHQWKVTEVIPNKKIVYNWTYKGYEGSADVAFEIFEDGENCKLQIKVIILEDFSDDIPEFRKESCIGGWEYFIQGRLKDYLSQ